MEPRDGARRWVGDGDKGRYGRREYLHLFPEKKSPVHNTVLGFLILLRKQSISKKFVEQGY